MQPRTNCELPSWPASDSNDSDRSTVRISPDQIREVTSRLTGDTVSKRIDQNLQQVEAWCDELLAEYERPSLDFEVPDNFLLSVVIPVFNEENTVSCVVARVRALPVPTEIIVVDDASTDGTCDALKPLELLPNVQVIYKIRNEGKGAALRTGFSRVRGDVVAIQDADLEYDSRDILPLLKPLIDGRCDVVYGSRFQEETAVGSSQFHQFGNWLLTTASNLTTGLRLTDMETCYKLFRRELIQQIPIKQNRFGFEPEITAKLARRGARFLELPIGYHARDWEQGKKIGVRDAFNAFYCIARYAVKD